jgi:tRNA pseudouridine38-40 synthase
VQSSKHVNNIKLIVAYLGTPFVGWQKTPLGPTIEQALENALGQILQHPIKLQAASRTDAGVHAQGQVVNFTTSKPICVKTLQHSLNGMLPKEIAILSAELMPEEFHPTLSCVKKKYEYQICYGASQLPFHRHTSWHFPYPLHLEQMKIAAAHLKGSHDFSSFCNDRTLWDRDPVCRIESIEIFEEPQQRLRMEITGDHFLYKMARNIAGTIAYVGCGKIDPGQIPAILASLDRTLAGITAPAHGLTLKQVYYSHDLSQ